MGDGSVVLLAVGDVGPIHPPMDKYGTLVRATLATGDIRIAQCERLYSERGALQLHSHGGHSRVRPEMASIFTDCGFNVASVASNHGMDWGPDALLDTIELLREKGIQTVGGGADLDEARKPVFIEKNGVTVAILAYLSVLNEGYQAGKNRPGLAPMRATTYYRAFDSQPGVPPEVVTVAYDPDLKALTADIQAAKAKAHAVVVVMHWGIHYIPRMIADYQPVVADAAFAAGADLILGHHAHVPKGIDVRQGKVCFHSLSNFIMTAPARPPERAAAFTKRFGVLLDPEYPHLPYGVDAKLSMIAKVVITRAGVASVAFLPVLIDREYRPVVLKALDARFADMVHYMEWASEGMNARFEVTGDEVRVHPRAS